MYIARLHDGVAENAAPALISRPSIHQDKLLHLSASRGFHREEVNPIGQLPLGKVNAQYRVVQFLLGQVEYPLSEVVENGDGNFLFLIHTESQIEHPAGRVWIQHESICLRFSISN